MLEIDGGTILYLVGGGFVILVGWLLGLTARQTGSKAILSELKDIKEDNKEQWKTIKLLICHALGINQEKIKEQLITTEKEGK